MKVLKVISFVIFPLLFLKVNAMDLPKPPNGFEWVECKEIKGAFLKPKNWYFKKVIKENSKGYFISKENIDKEGMFETGLTINVIQNLHKKLGVSPTKYAIHFMEAAASANKLKDKWENKMGPFNSIGFRYDKKQENRVFTFHNFLVANDKTGTLYFFIFEAPSKSWDKAWELGHIMLKKLMIDDVI